MSDRELLEWAAKAAGAEVIGRRGDVSVYGMPEEISGGVIFKRWNPLTDDGDALRLAVKLRIDLSMWIMRESVTAKTHIGAGRGIPLHGEYKRPQNDHSEPHNGDPYAATRRAIVRAAASIGQSQESGK